MKRVLLIVLVLVALLFIGGAGFVATFEPKQRPASSESIQATPERIERGHYLVSAVVGCMDCHTTRDWSRYPGPNVGPMGAGAGCYSSEFGFPGRVCIPNITPDAATGIGGWSDGEILRAIREGVDREGRGIFPMMPYASYRALSDADVKAIVAYLRTVPAVPRSVADSEIDFPVSFFIKFAPKPVEGEVTAPSQNDEVAYGKYLSTIAGCRYCHTPVDERKVPIAGREFSGGQEFRIPTGRVFSSNITPDTGTGIGSWTREAFVARFWAFRGPDVIEPQGPGKNTLMPWLVYANMTEADLGAIYAYLKSVPPLQNAVTQPVHP